MPRRSVVRLSDLPPSAVSRARKISPLEWVMSAAPGDDGAREETAEPTSAAERSPLAKRNGRVIEYLQDLQRLPRRLRDAARPSPLYHCESFDLPDGRRGLRATVAFPPVSTNNLYRTWVSRAQGGRIVRKLDDDVRWMKCRLVVELADAVGERLLPGHLGVDFRVFFPHRHKGDLFNYEKLVTDAVMVAIGNDDVYVRSGHMERDWDPERPRIEVCVYQVPSPAWDAKATPRRRAKRSAA